MVGVVNSSYSTFVLMSGAESGEDTDLGLTAKVRKEHRYVSHVAVDMGLKPFRVGEVEGLLLKEES